MIDSPASASPDTAHTIQSVTGPANARDVGAADAHCHLWISPTQSDSPLLADEEAARSELLDFAGCGGSLILDCQPGSTGRDGAVLERLSQATGVTIVASTGFHRREYYATSGPWFTSPDDAYNLFLHELRSGLDEAPSVRAGSIKAAWTGTGNKEVELMKAAATAAAETGAPLTIHSERGEDVEGLVTLLQADGVPSGKVQISHVDKRPDRKLHAELAREGYVLGYDTFLRPKYDPETNVWPLVAYMIGAGFWRQIAVGLDIVETSMWKSGRGPGLCSIPNVIGKRLKSQGAGAEVVRAMTGGNIARMLSGGPE